MRKERRFFPADAGADLQNDVAVIVRVARQQQHTQLLLELRAAGTAEIDLLARDLVQLGVAQQRLRLRDLRLTGGIRPVGLHDRLQLALLAAELCEHRGVGIIRGVGQLALQLAVPVFNLSQLFEHGAAPPCCDIRSMYQFTTAAQKCKQAVRLRAPPVRRSSVVYPRGMIACATFSSVPRSSTFT